MSARESTIWTPLNEEEKLIARLIEIETGFEVSLKNAQPTASFNIK